MTTDADRPLVHLTAESGWLNDPYGVTWWEGRYHLFQQYVPDSTQWSTYCHWREVDARDLVRWEHPRVALTPPTPSHGRWSGAAVVDDGRPTLLVTDVDDRDWGRGRIVVARAGVDGDWLVEETPVLAGPPAGLDVLHFRDPYVSGGPGRWEMVVGAGLADGSGALLGYTSPDLHTWQYTGVLARRSTTEVEPIWTGSVWECPQSFELDGAWVLVVSVSDAGATHHVAAGVGQRAGAAVTVGSWSRLWFGDALYATTTFLDTAGRRCALSWSRELEPVLDRAWAGALSLPVVLHRAGGRVLAEPHPDVDTLRTDLLYDGGEGAIAVPPQADVVIVASVSAGTVLQVALAGGAGPVLSVTVGSGGAVLGRPGRPDETMPMSFTGELTLRLIVDACLVEVFAAGVVAGLRIEPVVGAGALTVGGTAAVRRVRVHAIAV